MQPFNVSVYLIFFLQSSLLFCAEQNTIPEFSSYKSGSGDRLDECQKYVNSLWNQVGHNGVTEKDFQNAFSSSHLRRNLTFENDVLAGKDEDRHYTHGVKLSWIHSPCRNQNMWTRSIASKLFDRIDEIKETIYQGKATQKQIIKHMFVGGLFGMNIYTPNDLSIRERIINDRPYAGWLYGGFSVHEMKIFNREDSNNLAFDVKNLELQIGVVGPLAAQEYVQTWIHDDVGSSTIPEGWDNQIENMPGISLLFEDRLVYPHPVSDRQKLFISNSPHWGFNIGNISNYINVGYTISLSRDMFFYPSSTIAPSNTLFTATSISFDELFSGKNGSKDEKTSHFYDLSGGCKFSLFAGLDGRLYASNIFIDGRGDSEHNIDLENFVYDIYAGAAYSNRFFGNNFTFSYKFIRRSEEFSTSNSAYNKPHNIGHINIEWQF
ncbi:MAG: lipid A deacylase LpxR family protein [Candidatus Thiodiazotropha sp.]